MMYKVRAATKGANNGRGNPNYITGLLDEPRAMGDRTVVISGTPRVIGAEAFDTVLRFAATLRESG